MRLAACSLSLMMLVAGTTRAWATPSLSFVVTPYENPGAGNDVVVAVAASQADGVTSLDLSYAFDPTVLTPTSVFPTAYTHGLSLQSSLATPGVVEIHLAGSSPLSGSGDVAWVTFHIASGVASGTTTSLSWVSAALNGGAMPCTQAGANVAIGSGPTTISMPRDAFGLHGSQVSVPINASSLSGNSAFDLVVTFDPNVLAAVSVQKATYSSCLSLTSNVSVPGTVRISMFGLCSLTGSGRLATIQFNVVGANGSRTPLNVTRGGVDEDRTTSVLGDGLFNACGTRDGDGDGYSVCAGDCNDADPAVHPGAVEACNGIDDDCNGLVDDAPAPTGVPTIQIDEESGESFLSWPPVTMATAYDVLRGDLTSLRNALGSFSGSVQQCIGSRVTTNYAVDGSFLPEGQGNYYLVRPANCGATGSYDDRSSTQVAPRDPGVAASANACP